MSGLLCLPLTWRHTSDGFEGPEEGLLVGKTGFHVDICNLLVGILTQDALGVVDTVTIDKLGEGTAALGIDAVGYETPVTAKGSGDIRHLQFAVLVEFLLFQQLTNAIHEGFGTFRVIDDDFRF